MTTSRTPRGERRCTMMGRARRSQMTGVLSSGVGARGGAFPRARVCDFFQYICSQQIIGMAADPGGPSRSSSSATPRRSAWLQRLVLLLIAFFFGFSSTLVGIPSLQQVQVLPSQSAAA